MDNQQIIDKMTKVCICKSISRLTIKNIIVEQNLQTVAEVFAKTGAGSGSCKGRKCRETIQNLLDDIHSINES